MIALSSRPIFGFDTEFSLSEGLRQVSEPNTTNTIEERIEEAIEEAREASHRPEATPAERAAAWDAVEELQAEASHQKQAKPEKTSLERYCDDNPDAVECRLYDD